MGARRFIYAIDFASLAPLDYADTAIEFVSKLTFHRISPAVQLA